MKHVLIQFLKKHSWAGSLLLIALCFLFYNAFTACSLRGYPKASRGIGPILPRSIGPVFPHRSICPGCDNPFFFSWFPYQKEQTVRFSSGDTKQINIKINTITKTEAHKSRTACPIRCAILGQDNSNALTLSIKISGKSYYPYFTMQIASSIIGADSLTSDGIKGEALYYSMSNSSMSNSWTSEQVRNVTFHNKTYDHVQIITLTKDTTGIYKIWLAQNYGIIAFEEYPTKQLWVLKSD